MTNGIDNKPLEEIKLYTLPQVQKITGVSYRTLQNYVKDGRIKAAKIGGKWKVTEENLRAFLNGAEQN